MTDKIDISAEAVERYTSYCIMMSLDGHDLIPSPEGTWVRRSCYAALSARLAEVEALLKATLDRESETHKRHDARADTIPAPDALIRAALEAAADTCADNTWRHLGDDAYSQGLDRGALEQASACAASIRAIADDPDFIDRIIKAAEGRG